MTLPEFWFVLIGFMFASYFVLEGFDFGVGALLPVLGKDDIDRRVMINTIGPVWDANETWLVLAAGAMFAAFPSLVRHRIQRLLPAAACHPRGIDRARSGIRVPRKTRRCPVAAPVGSLHRFRLDRRPVSLGDVLCESGRRHADQRRGRLRRRSSRTLLAVHHPRRSGRALDVRHPRSDLHRAEDQRRHSARRSRTRDPTRRRHGRSFRGVPELDHRLERQCAVGDTRDRCRRRAWSAQWWRMRAAAKASPSSSPPARSCCWSRHTLRCCTRT